MSKKKSSGMNIGSVSLVVIFSVLCLTIFAVLSLSTALSEKRLAEKSAKSVSDYYAADFISSEKTVQIQDLVKSGATNADVIQFANSLGLSASEENGTLSIEMAEKIDENQVLHVILTIKNNKLAIQEWKVIPTADWQPDTSLSVWQGLE